MNIDQLIDEIISREGGHTNHTADTIIPGPEARDATKPERLKLDGTRRLDSVEAELSAIVTEANSTDPWARRARPGFLYVMYVIILWSIPMGLIAAVDPATAHIIGEAMNLYLRGIPDSLWALFGTGYLGYTAARTFTTVQAAK